MRRVVAVLALAAVGATGCGGQGARSGPSHPAPRSATTTAATTTLAAATGLPQVHPQAIEPVAGAGSSTGSRPPQTATVVSVGPPSRSLPQPLSDTQVRDELSASGIGANPDQATLTPDRLAVAPINAPPAVQAVIDAGNQIAHLPYVWGGGHATYEDTGYDCSGSISFVFAAARLLSSPVVSGDLMSYGDPGPGRWITIFANPGHTFMYVAGLRFDTVALAETGSRWSDRPADEPDLRTFSVRHPPGL